MESVTATYPITEIRKQFPILASTVYQKQLVYLDNGATTQKPQAVIQAITNYYSTLNSNVHRGVHKLSQDATNAFDNARIKVQRFINANKAHEIIFTKGATESINLVAQTWAKQHISKNDVILLTEIEHHSNIVPWQMLALEKQAIIKYIPLLDDYTLDLHAYENILKENNVKLVAATHISNVLGTTNFLNKIIALAHEHGAKVLIDGCQAVQHTHVDVQFLDADFYVFSAHKLYGPTGIGVLYAKSELLENMQPYQGGGSMIQTVSLKNGTTYAALPHKFEAGTPHIEGAIVFGAAIDFVNAIGILTIEQYEHELTQYAQQQLQTIDGINIYADKEPKSGVISFNYKNIHPFDIGTLLDKQGIAVRTGHHCCQPLMQRLGVPGTVRASFALYTSYEEVDLLVKATHKAVSMLQ